MLRWQKRLSDLQRLLELCNSSYMEPELFRLNVNSFLQTARTVTFLIQKDKNFIPGFSDWHSENIGVPWAADEIMTWAKESRNKIEKEGDLELHSLAQATLILGHLPETDQILQFPGQSLLFRGAEALVKSARRILPRDVANTSLIRVERRWVTETLPNHELLYALTVVYSRLHTACKSLTNHLREEWPEGIMLPSRFIDLTYESSQIYWIKIGDGNHYTTHRVAGKGSVADDILTPERKHEISALAGKLTDRSLNGVHRWHEQMAETIFANDGSHLSMLFMYRKDMSLIRIVGTLPTDRAEKYMFWRDAAAMLEAEGAAAFVYVGELWLRRSHSSNELNIDNLEIIGEQLRLITVAAPGKLLETYWNIVRHGDKVTLERTDKEIGMAGEEPSFLRAALRAIGVTRLVREV